MGNFGTLGAPGGRLMATDMRPRRPNPAPKASSGAKYDSFVGAQLGRARRRMRALDIGAAALGFLVLTLAYGLIMALLDRWLELGSLARQLAFGLYALGALAY